MGGNVKKLAILVPLALCTTLASADEAPKPTVENVTEQAQRLINAVRSQREAAADVAAQVSAQLVALQKELDEVKKLLAETKHKEPPK